MNKFMDIKGTFLKVYGKTTSSFHSTRREYASLVQTSPFILGSTLRGALLTNIIKQIDCPEWLRLKETNDSGAIGGIHRGCGISCPVKSFFSPSQVIFSFGKFDNMGEEKLQRTTRIAIEREKSSVSEGAIVNIETVPPETSFEFEVVLLGESLQFMEQIKKAVYTMAIGEGIGRYRSIGFGQFQIDRIEESELSQIIEKQLSEIQERCNGKKGIKLILRTPLVLGDGQGIFFPVSNSKVFIERFCNATAAKMKMLTITEKTLAQSDIKDVEMKIIPDYVHRFSYEIQNKENRLVAWPGSEIILHCEMTRELYLQFAIIAITGLGEWSDWGFGRFHNEGFEEKQ